MEMEWWGIYYEILNNFRIVVMTLTSAGCYYYFVKPFMKNAKKAWLVGAAYFLVMQVLYYMPPLISNFSAYFMGMLSGFLVMCFLDRKNICQKLFLAVTFFSIRWLSLAMESFFSKVMDRKSLLVTGYSRSIELQFGLHAATTIIDCIISFFIMFFIAWIMRKVYIYKQADMSKKEMIMLVMPSLSAMISYVIWQYFNSIYENDTGKSLFDVYGKYDALTLLHYGISLLTILVMIIVFQNLKARQEEEQQNIFLQRQIEDMKNHISEVEKIYRDVRCIRHDMRNHVAVLQNLYRKNDYEEAEKYLKQLTNVIDSMEMKIATGNPVTDVLLNEKQKEAEEKGIHFQCNFHYPENTMINAFDVSVILGNAITNAIEAAEKTENPMIGISSYRKKNAYVIEVINSFGDTLIMDEETGFPATSKTDRKSHGFGLINICKVARKYYGDIDIVQSDGQFRLCVMLMLET